MKTDLFQSCGHCWVFQICWLFECSTFTASSFMIWSSSTEIPSPPLALFIVMLPETHLTLHPGMWSCVQWSHHHGYLHNDDVFLYSSPMYSCHLFLISSASVRSIPFLSFIVPIFVWNIPLVSNFLEDISSLSHSIVFLYFFAVITEEGFIISPCYSLEVCIQMVYLSFFSYPLASLLFSAICKASSDNYFAFLHFFFLWLHWANSDNPELSSHLKIFNLITSAKFLLQELWV